MIDPGKILAVSDRLSVHRFNGIFALDSSDYGVAILLLNISSVVSCSMCQ